MNVLLDGFSVLSHHWQLLSSILLILLFGMTLTWFVFKGIFGEKLTPGEYFSLGVAGWMVPILGLSALWFLWGSFQAVHLDLLMAAVTIALFVLWLFSRSKKDALPESKINLMVLSLLFGIFILLRLAFVSQAILPLYFDSAEHYRIIKSLLGQLELSNTTPPFPIAGYYHIGFHLLALFITSIRQAEITDTMLILGQIILALIPLPVFFIIKHETRSNNAGLFGVLLAAFGWYMPAHVMDWGKYPALLSLLLIQFVLSSAYLFIQYKDTLSSRKYWGLIAILMAGILTAVFAHSRSLVIFGIVLIAWIAAIWWRRLPRMSQWLVFYVVVLGIISEYIFIQRQDVLTLVFDPYVNKGFVITPIVLFLFVFALKAHPQLTFTALLVIFLLLVSLFAPVTVPGVGNLTLLDRPYVEMILYLPLSVIGGLGLAGLEQYLLRSQIKLNISPTILSKYVSILVIGLVVINALLQYEFYPSDCCKIVGADDLVAIDWMGKNLPPDSRVLISAVELRVLASDSFQGYVGGDAGIWITPLTDRHTIPILSHSDFGQQNTLNSLCELKASHLYVGETGQTFDDSQINIHPEWYKILLSMPKVKVYEVIGCD